MTFMQYLQLQHRRKKFQIPKIVHLEDQIDLDFIGSFEHLENGFNELGKHLNIHIKLPHLNKSAIRKKHFRQHYDEQAYNFVNTNWANDIKLLNYQLD